MTSRNLLIGVFLVIFLLLGAELRLLWTEKESIGVEYNAAKERLKTAKQERNRLKASLEYLSLPENLEKELKTRFYYQLPDEKVIILVPGGAAASTSTLP